MIVTTLQIYLYSAILTLLFFGAYEDFKYWKVSKLVTIPIILLSIPLIYLNYSNITWFHLLFISMLSILAIAGKFSAADVKIMFPLILIFDMTRFLMFVGISLMAGGFISMKYRKQSIPFVPAILTGFIVALVLV